MLIMCICTFLNSLSSNIPNLTELVVHDVMMYNLNLTHLSAEHRFMRTARIKYLCRAKRKY